MATPAHDKYFLKSLHDEIDLFDRKLAHMLKYDTAGTDAERKLLAGKLATKRETLARTARQLASEGIEFKPADLPRSFRNSEDEPAAVPAPEAAPQAAPEVEMATVSAPRAVLAGRKSLSPFSGTVLDGQANIEAYKRARAKPGLSQA